MAFWSRGFLKVKATFSFFEATLIQNISFFKVTVTFIDFVETFMVVVALVKIFVYFLIYPWRFLR